MNAKQKKEMEKIHDAALEYIALRDRWQNPDGKFDSAGRWYPDASEKQSCCDSVRGPSRAYHYSYMTHCRTTVHVALRCGVNLTDLKSEVRLIEPPAQPPAWLYKQVAQVDGKLLSIYDGKTEYRLHEKMVDPAEKNHGGGIYCYATPKAARNAEFPDESKLLNSPRVILRLYVEGKRMKYDSGKIAVSRVIPMGIESSSGYFEAAE